MYGSLFNLEVNIYLQVGNSLFGLDIEEGNALLEALLVGLPGLQQLRLLGAVTAAQGRLHIRILHSRQSIVFQHPFNNNACNR